MHCHVNGYPAINFCSNNYLGLAHDIRLKQAAIQAIETYGTGAGASPLVGGTQSLTAVLQEAVADFKGTEASLVFPSGYQANVAAVSAIAQPGDFIFADKLNHASLLDGCILSGAQVHRYRHLQYGDLKRMLEKTPKDAVKWIVTDTVFSMDGDITDLKILTELAATYNAGILVDEAHATGLYGDQRSSGQVEQSGLSREITLQVGTFSKALGGLGAYVAGPRILIDWMINRSRGFIYSTAPSPGMLGSALEAVRIVQTDTTLKQKLWQNVFYLQPRLNTLLARFDLPGVQARSPIFPIILGDNETTMRVSERLLSEYGIFLQGIRPPSVPRNTARLRFTVSAPHETTQLNHFLDALESTLAQTNMVH